MRRKRRAARFVAFDRGRPVAELAAGRIVGELVLVGHVAGIENSRLAHGNAVVGFSAVRIVRVPAVEVPGLAVVLLRRLVFSAVRSE